MDNNQGQQGQGQEQGGIEQQKSNILVTKKITTYNNEKTGTNETYTMVITDNELIVYRTFFYKQTRFHVYECYILHVGKKGERSYVRQGYFDTAFRRDGERNMTHKQVRVSRDFASGVHKYHLRESRKRGDDFAYEVFKKFEKFFILHEERAPFNFL